MIYVLESRRYLARNPRWALHWPLRLRGMMGRRFSRMAFDALIFPGCGAVHSCFMLEAIDVVFVDSGGVVLKLYRAMKPWRFASGGRGAVSTIELPPGAIDRAALKIGFHINLNMNLTPETVEKFSGGTILNMER